MTVIEKYIAYIKGIKRYSMRTVSIYEAVLYDYLSYASDGRDMDDSQLLSALNPSELRSYEVTLMDSRGMSPKTVGLHLSVMSGFCRFLMKEGLLKSNPVSLVSRPRIEKRVPEFYRMTSALQDSSSILCIRLASDVRNLSG